MRSHASVSIWLSHFACNLAPEFHARVQPSPSFATNQQHLHALSLLPTRLSFFPLHSPPLTPRPTPFVLTSHNDRPRDRANDTKQGFVHVYDHILKSGTDPTGAQPLASVLRHLASPSQPPTPILTHCTAGKDRTGVLCALVLSLCGVPDEVIAHEYSLTDLGLGHRRDEFIENLTRSGPLKGNRAAAERMVGSRPEAMLGTLALIRREYGGVEEFVRGRCGLSEEEIEGIRKNLVVEVAEDQKPVDWEEHRKLLL